MIKNKLLLSFLLFIVLTMVLTSCNIKYEITFVNDDGTLIQTLDVNQNTKIEFTGETPIKEDDEMYSYTFCGWENEKGVILNELLYATTNETFKAAYNKKLREFVIKFTNGDVLLSEEKYNYGDIIEYKGVLPTQIDSFGNEMTLVSWMIDNTHYTNDNLPLATSNLTFVANFKEIKDFYTIVWDDGINQTIEKYLPGEKVNCKINNPIKDPDNEYNYTFIGWSLERDGDLINPNGITIEKDITFYAVYTKSIRNYSVAYFNGSNELYRENLSYGTILSYKGETPTKDSDNQYIYTFDGWIVNGAKYSHLEQMPKVTGNMICIANYKVELKEYKVSFDVEGEITTLDAYYGTILNDFTPKKENTIEFKYTFLGWSKTQDGEIIDLNREIIENNAYYYAVFKKVENPSVTINYLYTQTNDIASPQYKKYYEIGDYYGKDETLSPTISGYLPNIYYVEGIMNEAVVYTVYYSECDVWDGSVAKSFAGGTGTEKDPYLISSAAQLAYLSNISNKTTYGSGLYFKLTKSIDLNNISWTPICYAGGATTSWKYFEGHFDGNGKTISGLNFDQTSKYGAGLFTAIKGSVTNLTIEGKINALHRAGALCYYLNGGTATNIISYTNISTTGSSSGCYTGGIIGSSVKATVENCTNYGTVSGTNSYIAGISGKADTSQFLNCVNYGEVFTVSTSRYVGGIVGQSKDDVFKYCVNYADIGVNNSPAEKGVSGIAGWATYSTSVSNCTNYGNIIGADSVGQITGYKGKEVTLSNNTSNGTSKKQSA